MKIAVDAMGGDYAPGVVVEGLAIALTDFPEYDFVLVGHAEKLVFYLEKYGIAGHPRVTVVHAPSVCEMSEPSAISLRAKRDSSITVCARLLKEKKVEVKLRATGETTSYDIENLAKEIKEEIRKERSRIEDNIVDKNLVK